MATSTLTIAGDLAVTGTGPGLLTRITGRAVPYGVPVDVGAFVETISPGAFAESLRVTPDLPLHVLHSDAAPLPGVPSLPVGVSVSWDDRRDGLYGVWRLDTSPQAQEAGRLVAAGLLRGLSLRFVPHPDGSVWTFRNGRQHVTRTRARLVSVSLVSTPAYPTAAVSDIRSAAAHVAEHTAARDKVSTLGIDLGTDLIDAAITGSAAEMSLSADLVWTAIETHGATAAARVLDELADDMRRTRPAVAVNLARAAQCIDRDKIGAQLRNLHVDQYLTACGLPRRADTPRPRPTIATSRRRRRRTR